MCKRKNMPCVGVNCLHKPEPGGYWSSGLQGAFIAAALSAYRIVVERSSHEEEGRDSSCSFHYSCLSLVVHVKCTVCIKWMFYK